MMSLLVCQNTLFILINYEYFLEQISFLMVNIINELIWFYIVLVFYIEHLTFVKCDVRQPIRMYIIYIL